LFFLFFTLWLLVLVTKKTQLKNKNKFTRRIKKQKKQKKQKKKAKPMIKHIVLSGGGVCGFAFYTALRESFREGFWNYDDLQTIYGTSAGAILSVLLAMGNKLPWEALDAFMLRRPWHRLFKFNVETMVGALMRKGMFDVTLVEEIFDPLFRALDVPRDVTLQQLYDVTGKTVHLVTVELHSFRMVNLSHETHPDWRVVDAVYASMGLPVLCIPYERDGGLYADGGLLSNFPLQLCLDNGAQPHEILGLRIFVPSMQKGTPESKPPALSNLVDLITYLLRRMLKQCALPEPTHVRNIVNIYVPWEMISLVDIYQATSDQTVRQQLMDQGVADWQAFWTKRKQEQEQKGKEEEEEEGKEGEEQDGKDEGEEGEEGQEEPSEEQEEEDPTNPVNT
jgi:predicted acylesterase/phospholipase RssA